MATRITFKNADDGTVLAQGILGETVIDTDGSYYVDPGVAKFKYEKTDHVYNCPYKGHCDYYNFVDDEGNVVLADATWIYPDPNEGWEHITDKLGFYQHTHGEVEVEKEEF